MNAIRSEFILDLEKIRNYMLSNQHIQDILAYTPKTTDSPEINNLIGTAKSHLTAFRTRKVFEYRALIVSIYGCFEKYIESLIMNYLTEINDTVPNYVDLPDEIKKNHFTLSATLLNNLSHKKYENVTTKEKIVENMHRCATDDNYRLNVHAYIDHKANLKHEVVSNLISNLGIEDFSGKMKRTIWISEYFAAEMIIDSQTRNDVVFGKLDELSQHRNDVAHGVAGDVMHSTIVSDYVNYIEAYGKAVFDVLYNETLRYQKSFKCDPLGAVIKVFDFRILCVRIENRTVRRGDTIIVMGGADANPYYYSCIVQEIQIEKVKHESVTTVEALDIGLLVSGEIKENHSFYLLRDSRTRQLNIEFDV